MTMRASPPAVRTLPGQALLVIVGVGMAGLAAAPYIGPARVAMVLIGGAAVGLVVGGVIRREWAVATLVILAFTNVAAAFGSQNLLPAGLAALFGAAALLRRRGNSPDALIPFIGVAGLYVAYALLSMLWAANADIAKDSALDLGLQVVLAAGIVAIVAKPRHLRWGVWAIIGSTGFLGLLALGQFWTGDLTFDAFGLAQADYQQISGTAHAYRAGGPFGDANFFGQVMVVSLALALERMRSASTWPVRTIAATAAAIAIGTIFITYSRGALVASLVVCVLALLRMRHRVMAISIAVVSLAAIGILAPPQYAERIAQVPASFGLGSGSTAPATDPAIVGRTSSWVVAADMAVDSPLVGVGYGNYPTEYLDYSAHVGVDWRGEPRAPHSLPLQILAEQGVIGVLLAGALVAGAFLSLAAARRRLRGAYPPTGDYSMMGGVSDALLGYLAASLFLHSAHPSILWVLLALGWSAVQTVEPQRMAVVLRLGQKVAVPHRIRATASLGIPAGEQEPWSIETVRKSGFTTTQPLVKSRRRVPSGRRYRRPRGRPKGTS